MNKHKNLHGMWACDDNNSRIGWLRAPLVATQLPYPSNALKSERDQHA